jgi:hypothetical protein
VFFRLAPANGHDAPFAKPLLMTAVALYHLCPRVIRLDAAYWRLTLIAWIHTVVGAVAVIPFNPKDCDGLYIGDVGSTTVVRTLCWQRR